MSRLPAVVAENDAAIVPFDAVTRVGLCTLVTAADAGAVVTVTSVAAAVTPTAKAPAAQRTEQQRTDRDAEHEQPRERGTRREHRDDLRRARVGGAVELLADGGASVRRTDGVVRGERHGDGVLARAQIVRPHERVVDL